MDDPAVLWLVAIIMLAAGVIIGALATYLLRGEEAKKPEETAQPAKQPVEPPAPAPLRPPPGFTETLRIWQDPERGLILPEIRGERVSEAHRLTAAQKTTINQAMTELYKWLKEPAKQVAPPAQAPAATPPASAAAASPPPPAPLPNKPASSTTPFADSLPQQPGLREALNFNPFKMRKELKEKAKPVEIKTIIQMIDEILQAQIAGTPLAAQGVALEENPDGSMHIVGRGQQWNAVDEITDPEIKAAIQTAVTAFNRQQRTRP